MPIPLRAAQAFLHLHSVLAESQLPSVTPAAPHIGFATLQEKGATALSIYLPALLQIKGSLHDRTEALHVLPVPEGSPNTDTSMSFSGLEEGEWLENQCLILYPECYLAEFPSVSLVDNQSPILVPQGPGICTEDCKAWKKKK